LLALLVVPVSVVMLQADPPTADPTLQPLLDNLRPFLLEAVPNPLFQKSYDWGHQARSFHGVKWHGLRPEVVKALRNDGVWRKVKITAPNLAQLLVLKASDLKQHEDGRQTFKVYLSFRATVEVEQQNWESGVRLYSGSMHGSLRLHALLECENQVRFESGKGPIPDLVLRLRVSQATVKYDDLIVDHVAGLGGTAARILGDTIHDLVRSARPDLERDLLAKANAAIVKAADTREVRLSLGKLTTKK
jgi:hypothetical protein